MCGFLIAAIAICSPVVLETRVDVWNETKDIYTVSDIPNWCVPRFKDFLNHSPDITFVSATHYPGRVTIQFIKRVNGIKGSRR
jgi:hypothetical protein